MRIPLKETARNLLIFFPAFLYWRHYSCMVAFFGFCSGLTMARGLLLPNSFYLNLVYYSMILCIVTGIVLSKNLIRFILFFSAGFLLLSYEQSIQKITFEKLAEICSNNKTVFIYGRVCSNSQKKGKKYRSEIILDSLFDSNGISLLHHKNIICFSYVILPQYSRVLLEGTYNAPQKNYTLSSFDQFTWMLSSDIWGSFYCRRILAYDTQLNWLEHVGIVVSEFVLNSLDYIKSDTLRGIFQASLLGQKNELTDEIRSLFKKAGIFHLLALSGFHVALIITPLGLLLLPIPVPKEIKILILILFAWLYLVFTGFIASLFRAVVMATIFLISYLFQRKNYGLNSLGFAGPLWLIAYPMSLFTPGFQLSFAATAGILTMFPILKSLYRLQNAGIVIDKIYAFFTSAAAITCATFAFTAPVQIYHFSLVSLFGIPANLFAAALMGVSLWTFLIASFIRPIFPFISHFMFQFSEWIMSLLVNISTVSIKLPWCLINISIKHLGIYFLYVGFLLGFITVRREYLGKYLYWAVPILVTLIPILILLKRI